MGETRATGNPALREGMLTEIILVELRKSSPAPLKCLCVSELVARCMHYAERRY